MLLWRILYCPATSRSCGGSFLLSRCVLQRAPGLTTSRLLICTLVLTQACEPLPSFAAKKKDPPPDRTVMVKLPPAPKLKQIQGDQRVLHALDRLTFAPARARWKK